MEPRYFHDCIHCSYLGTWWRSTNNQYYDLYMCPPRADYYLRGPCLIARQSNEDSDYYSFGMESWDSIPKGLMAPLQEAYYRAKVLEYI